MAEKYLDKLTNINSSDFSKMKVGLGNNFNLIDYYSDYFKDYVGNTYFIKFYLSVLISFYSIFFINDTSNVFNNTQFWLPGINIFSIFYNYILRKIWIEKFNLQYQFSESLVNFKKQFPNLMKDFKIKLLPIPFVYNYIETIFRDSIVVHCISNFESDNSKIEYKLGTLTFLSQLIFMVNEMIVITNKNKLRYVFFPINLLMKGYIFNSLWKKKNKSQEKNKKKIKKLIYYYFSFAYFPRLLTFLASNFDLVKFAKNPSDPDLMYDINHYQDRNYPYHLFRNITNIIFMMVFNIALLRRKENLLQSFSIKKKDILLLVLIQIIPFLLFLRIHDFDVS
jgi:hypothetical protein